MSDSITFTDDIGEATLASPAPAPGSRFAGWTPGVNKIGPKDVVLGTGRTNVFNFRTDYLASFQINYLTSAQLVVVHRLIEHLQTTDAEVVVTLEDDSEHEYTCVLAPGTVPQITFTDRRMLEYSLSLVLKNTEANPMIADYE